MTRLEWTKIAPTEDGWYWLRNTWQRPCIIHVVRGSPLIPGSGIVRASLFDDEWCGPLEPPSVPKRTNP